MYFLEYLKDLKLNKSSNNYVNVEYRLLCSGEIYNEKVVTMDWRKSDATRLLLTSPFELTVVSQPFNDYPQELALQFKVQGVTEKKGNVHFGYVPDDEIAQDIASLLTLLCRRLITVAAKVRESRPSIPNDYPGVFKDWPVAFISSLKLTSWKHKPSTAIYGSKGLEEIIDYNPPPRPINPAYLENLFLALPRLEQAERIVLGARRYALALELIEKQPDFSYQSLISGVETVAGGVLGSYKPNETEMIKFKRPVYELALKSGLSEEQAGKLAIAACQGVSWTKQKFIKFLSNYVTDELWTKDDVFVDMDYLMPKKDRLESALSQIYNIRSKGLHTGEHYPISATVGTSPLMPAKIMLELGNSKNPFPPVTWFERVVNISLRTFLERSVQSSAPFTPIN